MRARVRVACLPHMVANPTAAIRPALFTDGGHDSKFRSNVVIARRGQNCLGTASFVSGHATQVFDNDCAVWGTERVDDLFENCQGLDPSTRAPIQAFNNRFYTQHANASASCDCCGLRPLAMLEHGIERNFTSQRLPSPATIIAWGRDKLQMPACRGCDTRSAPLDEAVMAVAR